MVTKNDLENIKDEIFAFAKEHDLGKDFGVFCNGKKYGYDLNKHYRYYKKTWDNVNPLDYCEYFPEEFVMGLSYDGTFYEMMNGYIGYGIYEKFEEMLKKHDMWIEHADSCHATIFYDGDDEIEYTRYEKEKIINVYRSDDAPDSKVKTIMDAWYELSRKYGDEGSCVLGAYLEMKYKGNRYRISPQSPYQGSISWESSLKCVQEMLEKIGATEIYYNCGHMD